MDLYSILNDTSTEPLTKEEAGFLIRGNYIITANTPDRIKNDPRVIRANLAYHIDKVDLSLFDFSSVQCKQAISSMSPEFRPDVLLRIHAEGYDISEFDPTGMYKRALDLPNSKILFTLICNIESVKYFPDCPIIHSKSLKELTTEEVQLAMDFIIESDIPLSNLTADLLEDKDFLTRYSQETSQKLSQAEIEIFTTQGYDPKIEQELIQQYDCKTIEELIHLFIENDIPSRNPTALAALKLHTAKKMHQKGIDDVTIHIFDDNKLWENASYDPNTNSINITGFALTSNYESLVNSAIHEATHAVQNYAKINIDYELEPDLDLYTKDDFLRDNVPNYYITNYNNICSEYDADMTAKIEVMKIKGLSPELHQMLREYALEQYKSTGRILEQVDGEKAYSFSLVRKDVEDEIILLDDYVIQVLEKQIQKTDNFEEYYAQLKEKYPLLCYEYDISPQGAYKKTPEELVAAALESEDEKDRGIYEYLIRSSVTMRKCRSSYRNLNDYNEILETVSLWEDDELRELITDLIQRNISNPSEGKYIEKLTSRKV